jgi:hypothetical protein
MSKTAGPDGKDLLEGGLSFAGTPGAGDSEGGDVYPPAATPEPGGLVPLVAPKTAPADAGRERRRSRRSRPGPTSS